MDLHAELQRLEQEIAAAEVDLIQRKAALAGLRAQREALAADLVVVDDRASADSVATAEMPSLRMLDRTDAIVEVLRVSERTLTIQEVWDGLKAGGRTERNYQVIASTLNFLHRNGRINKASRGRYAA